MKNKETYTEKIYTKHGRRFNFDPSLKIYNLGCGKQDFPGVIGVDKINLPHIKIQHDLNIFPWPIADKSADLVVAFHFIEHVDDLFRVIQEIHRITKPGGRIIIEVPHFRYSSAYKDPTHQHFFTTKTMRYFCRPNHTYTELPFKLKEVGLSIGYPVRNRWTPKYWLKKWLLKHLDWYDNVFYFFAQANILVFELEAEK